MSDARDWANIAAGNDVAVPDGAPEGWTGPQVNDWGREVQAGVKKFIEGADWVDLVADSSTNPPTARTITWVSDTQFEVAGVDLTSVFIIGRRLRIEGTGGPITTHVEAATYVTSTTVTITTGDTLPNPITRVFCALLAAVREAGYKRTGTNSDNVPTGADLDQSANHPAFAGTVAYYPPGIQTGQIPTADQILTPVPFSSAVGFGSVSTYDRGIEPDEIPTNSDLGAFAFRDLPRRKVRTKATAQTGIARNAEVEISGIGFQIPGANGFKRFVFWASVSTTLPAQSKGYMILRAYMGATGSANDQQVYRGEYGFNTDSSVSGDHTMNILNVEIDGNWGFAQSGDRMTVTIQGAWEGVPNTYDLYSGIGGGRTCYSGIQEVQAEED